MRFGERVTTSRVGFSIGVPFQLSPSKETGAGMLDATFNWRDTFLKGYESLGSSHRLLAAPISRKGTRRFALHGRTLLDSVCRKCG